MIRPVVTVTVGEHEVLRFDGENATVHVIPAGDQPGIVLALAKAKFVYPADAMREMRSVLSGLVTEHLPMARVLYWT